MMIRVACVPRTRSQLLLPVLRVRVVTSILYIFSRALSYVLQCFLRGFLLACQGIHAFCWGRVRLGLGSLHL